MQSCSIIISWTGRATAAKYIYRISPTHILTLFVISSIRIIALERLSLIMMKSS